jgi:predicted alpha/beta-fold hydrolase
MIFLILRLLALGVLVYAVALAVLWIAQRQFIYLPHVAGRVAKPYAAPPPYEDFKVTTTDGVTLYGWHIPAKNNMPTIVYFHGNADQLHRSEHYHDLLVDKGFGLLLTTYRGYSGHKGTPTEAGLYNDAEAFIKELHARGVNDIVIYGYSLGAAVALEMATRHPPKALVLAAPFLSLADAASFRFPYMPVRRVLYDRFDSLAKMPLIDAPTLVINGRNDPVFPSSHGKRLAQAAKPGIADYVELRGGHVSFFFDSGGDRAIAEWLGSRFGAGGA